jgi:ATP-dependent exoDNAse (exonuclease V) beta subunit
MPPIVLSPRYGNGTPSPDAGVDGIPVHRIAHLLESGRARPAAILAVTFSVRAASELRPRLAELLGERVACSVTSATFHAYARGFSASTRAWSAYSAVHDLRPALAKSLTPTKAPN